MSALMAWWALPYAAAGVAVLPFARWYVNRPRSDWQGLEEKQEERRALRRIHERSWE